MPGSKVIPHNGESDWKLQIIVYEKMIDKDNVFEDDITSTNLLQVADVSDDTFDYAKLLKKNLDFKYRNRDILSLPQKVSASDIAHSQNGDYFEKILSKPLFIAEQNSAPVARGTAHHKFLQYCNFEQARASLDTEIDRLLNDGKLTQEQVDMIDRKTLNEFLSTKLIDRIIASQLVMREKRFTARLKPSEVFDEYKDVKTDATVIIQGAVDLAFVEDGKLVIVDYKTDRVKDITKLAGLYKKQLDLYKSAMEQSEELTVKECILCSIHLGAYITV
jgi:recombination helicase addA, firmicutes type